MALRGKVSLAWGKAELGGPLERPAEHNQQGRPFFQQADEIQWDERPGSFGSIIRRSEGSEQQLAKGRFLGTGS